MKYDRRILVFAGSTREGAVSGKLAGAAAAHFTDLGCEATMISLADFPLPIYDGDLEARYGVPENGLRLARVVAESDAVFIATPEYNHSLPPLLKNAIDWMSRIRREADIPLRRKAYAIVSSSTGDFGGARALADLRKVLVSGLAGMVIPEQMSLPRGAEAFEGEALVSLQRNHQLRGVCESLASTVSGCETK